MSKLQIFTDGGSRGNPGPAACAFIVRDVTNKTVYQRGFRLGITTNNVAEYTAVLKSLEWISPNAEVSFYMDSLLVVSQLKGIYKIKDQKLKNISKQILSKIKNLKLKISFVHIPREQNTAADLLVNQTLDAERENE
jgi:ribonuclease HI